MEIGKRINTSSGELIVLYIQDKYLILFDDATGKFIKANQYDKDSNNKYYWMNGEYYNSFKNLVDRIEG